MAEKAWSAWYDAVLPSLPGLPAGTSADLFIKRAAIEFCDRSLAWQDTITAITTVDNTREYAVASSVSGTMVARLLELRYLNKALIPTTPAELEERYGPGQHWRLLSGDPPTHWLQEHPAKVTISKGTATGVVGALTGWAAIKPLDTATGVDEIIWREYHDEIADLAKAHAMNLGKTVPYSDRAEAQRLRSKVEEQLGFIALRMAKGRTGAPMRTKTHWI